MLGELWIRDSSGRYVKEANFFGVNLVWSVFGSQFVDLNPDRTVYCDIGCIPDSNHQAAYFEGRSEFQSGDRNRLNFFFSQLVIPFVQRSYVGPGSYEIVVVLYSENSPTQKRRFRIDWSGNWHIEEGSMFREIVITERPS